MKKVLIIDLPKKSKEVNINTNKKINIIGISLLMILVIIFITILFFNNLKLVKEIKILKKEKYLLNKEIDSFEKNSEKNIKEYKLYRLLCPKEVIGKKKVLFGELRDGAYVLLDDLEDIKIAYSFGISNMIDFDKALADKGIDVYMYDHTINKLPYENPKFHWKKIGITSKSNKSNNMKSLLELMKENGHLSEKNMILKIDIESNEWRVLQELSSNILIQFKYILVEFHFRYHDYDLYLECLNKLLKDHQIFHLHCSNCSPILDLGGENPICQVLEVSYIKKEGNKFKKDESNYPVKEFDYKICSNKPNLDKENNILKYCDNLEY